MKKWMKALAVSGAAALTGLFFAVLNLNPVSVQAGGRDTTAPIITGIELQQPTDGKITSSSDEVALKISFVEEESGLQELSINLTYVDENGNVDRSGETYYILTQEISDLITEEDYENGYFIYQGTLMGSQAGGHFVISYIDLKDASGNDTLYNLVDTENHSSGDYTLTGANGSFKTKAAVDIAYADKKGIDSLSLSDYSIALGGKTKVTVNVPEIVPTDIFFTVFYEGPVDVDYMEYTFSNTDYNIQKGKNTFTLDLSDKGLPGTYVISHVYMYSADRSLSEYNLVEDNGIYYYEGNDGSTISLSKRPAVTITGECSDYEAPTLSYLKIKQNSTVNKPGVATVSAYVKDATGVAKISAVYSIGERNFLSKDVTPKEGFTSGWVDLKFTVSPNEKNGDYQLEYINLTDKNGISTQYSLTGEKDADGNLTVEDGNGNTGVLLDDGIIHVQDAYEVAFEASPTSSKLVSKLKAMDTGATAVIKFVGYSTTCPAKVFEAIKGQDKNIVLSYEGIEWVFNGLTITDPKDIDVSVSLSEVTDENIFNGKQTVMVTFAPNGVLPGPAKIRLESAYLKETYGMDSTLSLYYVNGSTLELEASGIEMYESGDDTTPTAWIEFTVTHNSDFVFKTGKAVKEIKPTAKTITVTDGKASVKKALALKKVKLTAAYIKSGKLFSRWKVVKGDVKVVNSTSATDAYFYMGSSKVTIKAVYKNPSNKAQFTDTKTKANYQIISTKSKTLRYLGPTSQKLTKITVPDTVKIGKTTYKVVEVAAGAFKSCTKATAITVGKNVKTLGSRLFKGCKALKTVTFKSTYVKAVNKNAVKDLTKKVTVKVPAKSKASYKKALKKVGFKGSVK